MTVTSRLASLAFAVACAVSPSVFGQTPSSSAPAGKIRVLPDGRVLVGEGVVKASVDFLNNDSLLISFIVAGGKGKGAVVTCEEVKKMPDLSGEVRETFILTLQRDLLNSPQGVARVAQRIESFPSSYVAEGRTNILRAVVEEAVTQFDEGILLAKLICGSTLYASPKIN